MELIKIFLIIEKDSGLIYRNGNCFISLPDPVWNFPAGFLQHIHVKLCNKSIFFKHRDELIRIVYGPISWIPAHQCFRTVQNRSSWYRVSLCRTFRCRTFPIGITQIILWLEIHVEFPVGQGRMHLTFNLCFFTGLLMDGFIIKRKQDGRIALHTVKRQLRAVDHRIRG